MFRVPSDPDRPTFDHTFKVGFFKWLTSSKADRVEWERRRNAAAATAAANQQIAIEQMGQRVGEAVERTLDSVDQKLTDYQRRHPPRRPRRRR